MSRGTRAVIFRPIRDSARIYAPLLGFLVSSCTGFIVDALALFALVGVGFALLLAIVLARIISALTNFSINRMLMNDGADRPSRAVSLGRYAILAVGILLANAALMEVLTALGVMLLAAKILTELTLIPLSFAVQRPVGFPASHRLRRLRSKTSAHASLPRTLCRTSCGVGLSL